MVNRNRDLRYSIVIFTLLISYGTILYYILSNFMGFPETALGVDAVPHSAKINIIKSLGFEGFKWFPTYYFGNPHFTFYTPSTYILPATVTIIFDLNYLQIIQLLNWMSFFSAILILAGIVSLLSSILESSSKIMPIIGASFFLISSPGLLEPWLWGGNYPEFLTLPAIPWGLLLIEKWLRTNKRIYLMGYLALASFSIMGHQAVGGFLVLSTLLWIFSDEISWKIKMKRTALLLIFLVGLTTIYLGPLIYFELTTKIRPGLVENLPHPFNIGDYLPVFVLIEIPSLPKTSSSLPGTPIFLFFIYYIYYLKGRDRKTFLNRVAVISLIPILLIIHFFLATQKIIPWIAGFHPARYMKYLTIFSSIVLGIILSSMRRKHLYVFFILVILTISLHYVFIPSYERHRLDPLNLSSPHEFKLINELQASIFGNHFRIGGIKDHLFNIISLLKPDYYMSRGYYAQGILYLDWQYWFEYTLSYVSNSPSNENAFMHLLDWSSIRYLGLTDSEEAFKIAEEKFNPIGKLGDFTIFENDFAPPISEFLYSGAVLVFADYEGYDVLLRSIAISSYSKPAPIIIWAEGRCIDDIPPDVLEKFSVTVLYRYCYRDRVKAFQILENYVSDGGRLFIETMPSIDESSEMPLPIPVSNTYRTKVENDWNFKIAEHSLTT